MFARMTALHFQPEKAEQGFDIVQHAIVPTIKEQGAFKGLLLLRDPVTGTRNCRDAVGLRGGYAGEREWQLPDPARQSVRTVVWAADAPYLRG